MATSSITKQWIIKSPEAAERLLQIIEDGRKRDEEYHVTKACELVSDFEIDHPEVCYAGDDIKIIASFYGETIKDAYHVILMTDHMYDVQFHDDYVILETYSSCDFRRYEKEDLE